MATALVGIGSNLGDSLQVIRGAIESLREVAGVDAVRTSRLFRSKAIGGPDGQRPFLNAAAVLQTSLAPEALLKALQAVENRFGRTRPARWAARTLDLDLLLFEDVVLEQPDLTLPHPRMSFRRFVLEPAAEVAAEMRHPVLGCTVDDLLQHLDTAPHYVAIGGLNWCDRNGLAGALQRSLKAPLLLDHAHTTAVPPLPEILEFVSYASQMLQPRNWNRSDRLRPLLKSSARNEKSAHGNPPAVSDSWIDQWRLWACLHRSTGRARVPRAHDQLSESCERQIEGIVIPKLVIWLDGRVALASHMQERLPMCLDGLFRESSCRALLRLEEQDPDRMLAESLAAIEAMEPLEGVV